MKVNPISNQFNIKKGDTYPPIRIKLYNTSTDDAFDLTDWTGKFYMAPVSDKTSPIINGEDVTVTSAEDGEAQYEWQDGDTDEPGKFYYEFRFTSTSGTFSTPVISPGIIYIETIIESA